jgi:phage portal protein BeeE
MRILTPEGNWQRVKAGFLEGTETTLVRRSPIEFISLADGTAVRRDYEQVYLSNPWLFATFNMKSNGAARMPAKVYRIVDVAPDPADPDGEPRIKRERIRPRGQVVADPKLRRAQSLQRSLSRPGGRVSAPALRRSTMINSLTWGVAVWVIERDRFGDYTGFRRIPYRHLGRDTIGGVIRYWDTRKPSQKYLEDDVVQFGRGRDCYDLDSPSPLGSLHSTLALYDAVSRFTIGFFRNQAAPSGHYKIQPGTGKSARALIRQAIQEMYAGPDNAGKVLITSAEWQTHGAPTLDHNRVIELAKQSREECVAVFNMPPPMVGILDRAIMSNVRELRSHYARDVVGPDMELLEGDIDAQVIAVDELLADDVYMKFELANIMRPDPEARAGTFRDRLLIESVNEIRDDEELDRIDHPDADVPWMPRNEMPLGEPTAGSGASQEPPLFQRQEGDE